MHQTPVLPTDPSARTGVPVKHALGQGLHSSSEDDDEPPQLVSAEYADEDGFEGGDTMAAMCIKCLERKGAGAGPPVMCWAHVQGLDRGQAAGYWAHCTNQAAEVNIRRLKKQHKAKAPVLIPPIPEPAASYFEQGIIRLLFSLLHTARCQVHLSISVLLAYTTQFILHALSC